MRTAKIISTILILTLLASGCAKLPDLGVQVFDYASFVIYGEDDRQEVYSENSIVFASLSLSSAAIFKTQHLNDADKYFEINRKSFGEEFGLCEDQRFTRQKLGPVCSGVLVAEDLVLTAGHCIESEEKCQQELVFNFDFFLKNSSDQVLFIGKEKTYSCKEVILKIENVYGDFALVQLDRAVEGITPIDEFASKSQIDEGESLVMTGFPSGLPLKITGGGKVTQKLGDKFMTNLDSFGGNSGSPVYSEETGLLLGILSRGELDFEKRGDCNVVKHCEEENDCNGEAVSYLSGISEAIEQYKSLGYAVPIDSDMFKPRVHSSFTPYAIPDFDFRGIRSEILIDQSPEGRKVYIGIDIEHQWVADLKLILNTPDGSSYLLRNLEPGAGDGLQGVYGFDLVSRESLRPISSMEAKGIWSLEVIDTKTGDKGTLKNWRVIFN